MCDVDDVFSLQTSPSCPYLQRGSAAADINVPSVQNRELTNVLPLH